MMNDCLVSCPSCGGLGECISWPIASQLSVEERSKLTVKCVRCGGTGKVEYYPKGRGCRGILKVEELSLEELKVKLNEKYPANRCFGCKSLFVCDERFRCDRRLFLDTMDGPSGWLGPDHVLKAVPGWCPGREASNE